METSGPYTSVPSANASSVNASSVNASSVNASSISGAPSANASTKNVPRAEHERFAKEHERFAKEHEIFAKEHEIFVKEHTNEFSKLRNVQKKYGDMFLFGEPTPLMMTFLLKLYHEYIAKIAFCKNKNKQITTDQKEFCEKNLRCMMGVLQTSDDQLYVTISEDPKEDREYFLKRNLALSIMQNAGITIEYPEDARDLTEFQTITQNVVPGRNIVKWRVRGNNMFNEDDTDAKAHILTPDEGTSFDYDERILNELLTVNYVDSWEYLKNRRSGKSFAPFKKYEPHPRESQFEILCNNGSTCTEAKLFGYWKTKNEKLTDPSQVIGIKSFVAYWIGNDYPPNHHIPSYSFTPSNAPASANQLLENQRLNDLLKRCDKIVLQSVLFRQLRKYSNYIQIMKNVVQPMALACPGCLANARKYVNLGAPWNEWNYRSCKVRRTTRISAGGKHKTGKRKTMRRKSSRRH
jgi:hypothetical protein